MTEQYSLFQILISISDNSGQILWYDGNIPRDQLYILYGRKAGQVLIQTAGSVMAPI